jgi:hypothetical protein
MEIPKLNTSLRRVNRTIKKPKTRDTFATKGILPKFVGASAIAISLLSGLAGCDSKPETPSNNNQIVESNTDNKILVDDSIFQLIQETKKLFPINPYNAERQPSLKVYVNDSNGAKAYVIEDVHNSRVTHELLEKVLKQLVNKNPDETLFILEGIKPAEINKFKKDNSKRPNEICSLVANQSGAKVINPIANIAQWKLISNFIDEAQKAGYNKEEALGLIVTSWVFGSEPELEIDISRAIQDLKTKWGNAVNIEGMYESADKALDAGPTKVKNFSQKIDFEDLLDWTNISKLIEKEPSNKQEIIGLAICYYAAQTFGPGKYPDALKSFKKMQKLWGNEAPLIAELHEYLQQGMINGVVRNKNIGKILFSEQDKASYNGIVEELQRSQPENIVVIAGFNHAPGIYKGLEAVGFQESQ